MATNFEFYKDAILGYVEEYASFPAFVNGKLVTCVSGDCQQCIFRSPNCFAKRVEWLYAEHIEPPKLTKRERALCEYLSDGYIARNEDGEMWWYPRAPIKTKGDYGCWEAVALLHLQIRSDKAPLNFIQWEDEKPWAVEELLKLEVREE